MPAAALPPPTPRHVPLRGVFGGWARALHRRQRRPEADANTPQVRLAALIALLDDAVGAQTAADQAIAVCGEPLLLVTAQQQVVRQTEVYHQLVVRLRALNPDETCAPLHRRASRLLAFHEALLQEALSRVSAAPHGPAEERARQQLLGLGAPADALRRLRDEVSALADRSDATGDRS